MNRWFYQILSVLLGLALGTGLYALEYAITTSDGVVEGRCWRALLNALGWSEDDARMRAVAALRTAYNEHDPLFEQHFLFNTSDEVADAYGVYAWCVELHGR